MDQEQNGLFCLFLTNVIRVYDAHIKTMRPWGEEQGGEPFSKSTPGAQVPRDRSAVLFVLSVHRCLTRGLNSQDKGLTLRKRDDETKGPCEQGRRSTNGSHGVYSLFKQVQSHSENPLEQVSQCLVLQRGAARLTEAK